MVPPPWHLVSPAGVVHVVHDEVQLRALAESESEELIVRRENLLRKLVDPDNRMALNQLPVHKYAQEALATFTAGRHVVQWLINPSSQV